MGMISRVGAAFILGGWLCAGAEVSTNLPAGSRGPLSGAVSGLGGDVVVWEASADAAGNLTDAQIEQLAGRVRKGASLFLLLGSNPGTTPMRLGFMLPSTEWGTQVRQNLSMTNGTVANGPRYFDIRPVSAVERGEQRYEGLARTIPYTNTKVKAGNVYWTRPLLNRGWAVKLAGEGVDQAPLLVTGQYGAGRVAIFASSAVALDGLPGVWASTLLWLADRHPAGATDFAPVTFTVKTEGHGLHVEVLNPSDAARSLVVLVRALTWEHAFVGDVEKAVNVPAGGRASVTLPLPEPSPTGYQALEIRDAFVARVGVLSGDGSVVLSEKQVPVDFAPSVHLTVRGDNLHSWKYPFHAPGPDVPLLKNRMGARVTGYAYPPGAAVHAEVEISNGTRNLAAGAQVVDETTPANPSLPMLTDGASYSEKTPIDNIEAFGEWRGAEGRENSLVFTFPRKVTVSAVVLVGNAENERQFLAHNPGAVVVEADGVEIEKQDGLDALYQTGDGRVRVGFQPVTASAIRVRLPWVAGAPAGAPEAWKRLAPWIGEVEIEGFEGVAAAPLQGMLSMRLTNVLTGESIPVGQNAIQVQPGASARVPVEFTMPVKAGVGIYRLEAQLGEAKGYAPLMTIDPPHALIPMLDLHPRDAVNFGFIVTRGFRNTFDTGTGTKEVGPSWGQPDDLIYAYERQFKQLTANSKTAANRLYVTENDMRHYSTPWRGFASGERFFEVAAPSMVEFAKKNANWDKSDVVILGFSDRWDTGPQMSAMHGWEDFVDFDEHVRALGLGGIEARDRVAIAAEIHNRLENEWQAWQLDRYVRGVRDMREAFAKAGKKLVISAQGLPMVAAPVALELAQTIGGMSDDETWGMAENNIALTTGRQLAEMAFNPVWRMTTLVQWGFNSSTLNNPHWHAPVGTTEPTRRHYYDRAWRGMIGPDGVYRSMYTYGYNSNAGLSFTMTENDWQQWWQLEERHSLLSPEAPLGAGMVMSTSRYSDLKHIRFTGGGESTETNEDARGMQQIFRRLHDAGVSIPFSTNVSTLGNWKGDAPLILTNLEAFSAAEIGTLRGLHDRGVKLAAFQGSGEILPEAAALFMQPGTLLIQANEASLTVSRAKEIAAQIQMLFDLPLRFPEGTAGYGFTMSDMKFVVVEDWQEAGRVVQMRVRATPGMTRAQACDVNDHAALAIRRDGADWVIDTPLRPGDGVLLAIAEAK